MKSEILPDTIPELPEEGERDVNLPTPEEQKDAGYKPKDPETEKKYLDIYEQYINGHRNQTRLAKELGLSRRTVFSAVKWVSNLISIGTEKLSKEEKVAMMVDKMSKNLEGLERMLSSSDTKVLKDGSKIQVPISAKDKTNIFAEIRRQLKMVSGLTGLLKNTGFEGEGAGNHLTVVHFSPEQRQLPPDPKIVEGTHG